ncbi:sigma-70 family RNA polymerase sigma factor [Pelagicoccus mobilis]|uniref:Sigma-70 family RNA polymerase sigma factor n=1 Tax=Pelagicoccus mobilis TaxID=415221 RepID=A0A934VLK1_9BACT|nr:sigma-70 family RNA polymerase sigma factor [Pelagicoccus mobilis]MBK1877836.1 sigma-70 family RNA polymerase sigma factor [Pelagicoccus mobilis]
MKESIPDTVRQQDTASVKDALSIARFRSALDWTLALPTWQTAIVHSLAHFDIAAGRQGVSQATALRSLPIERKYQVIRHLIASSPPTLGYAETNRLARLCGYTSHSPNPSLNRLGDKRWEQFCSSVRLRLSARYEQYKSSQNELFAHHYSLPARCVARICSQSSLQEDALQEARLALLDAIDRIDPEENFASYARHWVERRVKNFLMREQFPVTAPINEISKTLRSDTPNPNLTHATQSKTIRLDQPSPPADASPEPHTRSASHPNHLATISDECDAITSALSELTEKQREVIQHRFGLGDSSAPLSLAQVAQQTGISRQQVFQREKRALQRLRELLAPIGLEKA